MREKAGFVHTYYVTDDLNALLALNFCLLAAAAAIVALLLVLRNKIIKPFDVLKRRIHFFFPNS